ncbi:MAG: PAS domain-containing protein [Candidatus Dadabacteria bacterium]|nr:PAS domain-containing protein [Candidatus Dadabacteria bacterium]
MNLLETISHQIGVAIKNAKQAEALRQSEERYRILFDQSPVGVYLFDTDLKVTNCNQRMVQILRSSYDKIIGFCIRDLKNKNFLLSTEKTIEGKSSYQEGFYEAYQQFGKNMAVAILFSSARCPRKCYRGYGGC